MSLRPPARRTRRVLLAALLGGGGLPVWVGAHSLPIHPVEAELKVDEGRARVRFVFDAVFWNHQILGGEPPLEAWPDDLFRIAQGYLRTHFTLKADGEPLKGALKSARFYQEPWSASGGLGALGYEGMLEFRMEYPLPKAVRSFSGRAAFFSEQWKESKNEAHLSLFPEAYVTILSVPGRKARTFQLPIDAPAFEIPAVDARRTFLQAAEECFLLTLFNAGPAFALVLLGAAAMLGGAPRQSAAVGAAAACAAAAVAYGVLPRTVPPAVGSFAAAAAFLMAAAALFRARPEVWAVLLAAAGALAGFGLTAVDGVVDGILPYISARTVFFLGGLAAVAVGAAAGGGALRADLRRLRHESESRAVDLFENDRRFAAALTAALAAALALHPFL